MPKYDWTKLGVDEFNRVRAKVDGMTGHGIHNSPTSLSHNPERLDNITDIPTDEIVTLKINGSLGGLGRYSGNVIYGASNNNPGSSLAATDIGNASTKTVEIWDLSQVPGTYGNGFLFGLNSNTGNPIYLKIGGGAANQWVALSTPASGGGSDGTASSNTYATWCYDLYIIGTSTLIAKEVPLFTARPWAQQTSRAHYGQIITVASNTIVGVAANIPSGQSGYGFAPGDTSGTVYQPYRLMSCDEQYPGDPTGTCPE